jgi:hypothetical protein
MFENFTWYWFAIMAAVYTLLAFSCVGFKSAMVFSKRNAIPTSTVWTEHLKFLTILLVLMWIGTAVCPSAPGWMKDKWIPSRSSKNSDLDFVFLAAVVTLHFVEHRRIYAEAESEGEAPQ